MWVGVLTFYFLNNIFAYTYFKRRVSGSLKLNLQVVVSHYSRC